MEVCAKVGYGPLLFEWDSDTRTVELIRKNMFFRIQLEEGGRTKYWTLKGRKYVFLGCFYERINNRACLGTGRSVGKKEVFPANDEWFNTALCPVVGELQATVLVEVENIRLLAQAISPGPA